jgi:glucosamine--fructose-6-phosphate aminotransferase (isomerizing)
VKSLGKFPDPFLAEIAGQPAAIRRAADRLAGQSLSLERLSAAAAQPVVFTGMGASYAACYAPVTLLSGLGVPATMVDTAELLHFRRPQLRPGSVVVVVSQSGRSAEAVRLVRNLDPASGPLVVAVTNGADTPVGSAAAISLDTAAGAEHGPSTLSFAACLVVLAAVGEVLAGTAVDRAVRHVADAAATAAAAAERLLSDPERAAARSAAWFDNRPTVVVLGRGTARAASEVGALVLKEAARIPAESLESAQFRHGPLELAGAELAGAIVATEPETEALDLALASELARAGASVLVVARAEVELPGVHVVALGDVDRALAPAVAPIPFQLLAWRAALDRGLRPGMLEIASKVTTRE